jgi:ATP-dependent RNA helicase RhlE
MLFKDLGLDESLLRALTAEGYTQPTPIQAQAIPVLLKGTDLLGCAQTGTGKTAAFSLPILQLLDQSRVGEKHIRALILTPTRELAIQINESIGAYGKHTRVRYDVIFGGVGQGPQVKSIQRGLDILIATPGRLLDLIQQGFIDLGHLEIFVLDEADRMLDMGFIHDVKKIIKLLPVRRQTLFFSATMPPEIQKLADQLLTKPVKIEVTPPSTTVEKIKQSIYFTNKSDKNSLLVTLIETMRIPSALAFTRTKHGANKVVKYLTSVGIKSAAIHGNKSQTARQNALNDFKAGKIKILVATDIAARGIDIDELSYVFNMDLPEVPETYVHRIGRTGRAGNEGSAIAFCAQDEMGLLKDIQKLIKIQLPVVKDHPFPMERQEVLSVPTSSVPGRYEQRSGRPQNRNYRSYR